jgi:hypothetical protein
MHRLFVVSLLLAVTALGCQAVPSAPSSSLSQGHIFPDGPPPPAIDARRSLAVTDQAILARFSLIEVLNRFAQQSRADLVGWQVFRQWWDSARPAPGVSPNGPHCDGAALQRYAYQCPRAEGDQVAIAAAAYTPVGLFNRFDLAPADGSNCGEYRMVFAKTDHSVVSGRTLVSFDGVLPNPHPEAGADGCLAVAQFWVGLTNDNEVGVRATKLHGFYFDGLPGFTPVVHIDHYGAAGGRGRIRTNQMIASPPLLREFQVARCTTPAGGNCGINLVPTTTSSNPYGPLFAGNDAGFVTAFSATVDKLVGPGFASLALAVDEAWLAAESPALKASAVNDYRAQLGAPLRAAIQARLTALGSPRTPAEVVARATALSCAGCHATAAAGLALGGGLTLPPSLDGVHVSEQATEPGEGGLRYVLSPALLGSFLGQRQQVLSDFIVAHDPCGPLVPDCCGNLVCWSERDACPIICIPQPPAG